MALLTEWIDDARRSYCAYGVDFIRTACLLLCTTPSLAYRAGVLFQRFQAVAEEIRRKRGDYNQENCGSEGHDGLVSATASLGVTYTLPAHVGTERPSGIFAFGDPYAPLDYCVFHLMEHDDITYLTAACVLIATKIEDPSTRIRFIIGVFMRLNQRRHGEPVIELLQPPPERYDDFKLCVLEAEEVILQALGFQTFVECPFKYAIFFLGVLVEDDEVDADGAVVNQVAFNDCFANITLKNWLADAVCWLNDIPRSIELYSEEAHVLALCALFATLPTNINGFPDEWTLAFGVEKSKLNAVLRLHKKHLEQAISSAENNIRLLIATKSLKPYYPTATTPTPTPATMDVTATAGERSMGVEDAAHTLPSVEVKPDVVVLPPQATPVAVHPILPPVHAPIPPPDNAALAVPPVMASLNVLGTFQPALYLNLVAGGNQGVSNSSTAFQLEAHRGGVLRDGAAACFATVPKAEEEFYFEDLKEMRQRRRRQEEEEAEARKKRRRSSSRRRHHRSGDGRRRRSSSRRRENSRGGRRRRRSPTEHSRGSRRDDDNRRHDADRRHHNDDNRRHHDDRQRHDGRKRQNGRQRKNGKS